MNKATFENVLFFLKGTTSLAFYAAIFFGTLIIGIYAIELVTKPTNHGALSIRFLIWSYLAVVVLTMMIVILLRLKAIRALKKSNKKEYLKFKKADNKTKHEILGRLI